MLFRSALSEIINKKSTAVYNPITSFINVVQELLDKDDELGANVRASAYGAFNYAFTRDNKQHDLFNDFIANLSVEKIAKLLSNENLLKLLVRLEYKDKYNLAKNLAEIFAKIDFVKFLNEYAKINNNNEDLAQFVKFYYVHNQSDGILTNPNSLREQLKINLNNAKEDLKEKIIKGANSLSSKNKADYDIKYVLNLFRH